VDTKGLTPMHLVEYSSGGFAIISLLT